MKHIKQFNESSKESVKEFCEVNLAYLIDEGFVIELVNMNMEPGYLIKLRKRGGWFRWSDIKDEFMPFINIVQREYTLMHNYLQFTRSNNETNSVKISTLDNITIHWDLSSIILVISK